MLNICREDFIIITIVIIQCFWNVDLVFCNMNLKFKMFSGALALEP